MDHSARTRCWDFLHSREETPLHLFAEASGSRGHLGLQLSQQACGVHLA